MEAKYDLDHSSSPYVVYVIDCPVSRLDGDMIESDVGVGRLPATCNLDHYSRSDI